MVLAKGESAPLCQRAKALGGLPMPVCQFIQTQLQPPPHCPPCGLVATPAQIIYKCFPNSSINLPFPLELAEVQVGMSLNLDGNAHI